MPNILITHDIPQEAAQYLTERGFAVSRRATRERVCRAEELADFDGVLSMGTRYPAETILGAPRLRIIAFGSAGFDFADVAAAKKQGVAVTNAPGVNARSVAEHTAMLILACTKDLAFSARCIRSNDWSERLCHFTQNLTHKTLGIVGMGRIGCEVAQIMHDGFQMKILAYRRPGSGRPLPACAEPVPELDALLARSDVVSLHVPLTPETEGMIGRAELQKMKPRAILINCARGRVVQQDALTEALKNGTIAFAGLDVLAQEPPNPGDPLLSLPNMIVTPHNAAITRETTERVCLIAANNIEACFSGRPIPNLVY